mgnify:CR=1 FL=1
MAHTAVAKKQSEPKMSRALVRQETIAGYLFLLPSLIFFIGFVIYPMVMCIFTSFFDSSMNRADVFIGLQNYVELFHDSVFLGALRNTLIIVVVSVPITCIFSLWVASAIVNMPPWATSLFRVIFYLPVVTGSVAVTVVWKWMFNNYYGIFNYLGKSMGLLDQNINWLGDTRYALDGMSMYFPVNGAYDPEESLAIVGDWSQLVYAIRQDMTFKIFDSGVVQDPATGNILYNLMQNDMVALRAVMRLGWEIPNPINAYNAGNESAFPFAVYAPAGE